MDPALSLVVTLVDSQGKSVFQKSYYAKSDASIPAALGVYDTGKFTEMLPGVIHKVYENFAADIAGF
jgi:hypothetical protein